MKNGVLLKPGSTKGEVVTVDDVGDLVGGWIDLADCPPYRLYFDEEGQLKHLPPNELAGKLFSMDLVGNVVVMRIGNEGGESVTEADIEIIANE